MHTFTVNTYGCIKQPKVVSTIPVNEWFNLIRESNYSTQISEVRQGLLDYDKIKSTLPSVTYNFLFDGYKTDSNIISSSGLIYIDIDNSGFDIKALDLSKVYAYYKSFGGKGYALVIKASGVTKNNFNSTYTAIADDLGISNYIDKQAIKASQFNVLSYDENIFINESSYTYSSVEVATQSIVYREQKEAYTISRGANERSIRFDNLDEIQIKNDYVVNWDGYDYIKCFIPIKPRKNNRNAFLLSYANNLVYLNPHISKEKTIEILTNVSQYHCIDPVGADQICRVANSVHNYLADGSLKPIYFRKKRKIVFHRGCKLNREEKLEVCRAECALKLTDQSKGKILNIILQWDFRSNGKISQRKVYENHPISKKTVEKYWKAFKATIEMLNKSYDSMP